jgi:hypothetical protein
MPCRNRPCNPALAERWNQKNGGETTGLDGRERKEKERALLPALPVVTSGMKWDQKLMPEPIAMTRASFSFAGALVSDV